MFRNNFGIYQKFFKYIFKEKCKTLRTISHSTRALLVNVSRSRNFDFERSFYQHFKHKFNEKKNKYFKSSGRFLLGATIFSFAEDKITDEEIQDHFMEFYEAEIAENKVNETTFDDSDFETKVLKNDKENMIFNLKTSNTDYNLQKECQNAFQRDNTVKKLSSENPSYFIDSTWTQMIDSKSVKLWRRPLKSNNKLFEYRLCGSFNDISAKDFFFVQTDIEYRRTWDDLVVDLRVLNTDESTQTEIIRWVTHYPYPMKDREYIFKRRSLQHKFQETAIIVSRSINSKPTNIENINPQNVKVHDYKSVMYIQAHTKFDKHGIDYFLIYYDDPKTSFPNAAVSWMSTAGIPTFMDKVHKAALQLEHNRQSSEVESVEKEDENRNEENDDDKSATRDISNESFYSYFTTMLLSLQFNKAKADNGLHEVHKSQWQR